MTHNTVSKTAPGKLFLIGEYAVLEGAPAILVALPQLATATIKHDDNETLTLLGESEKIDRLPEAVSNTPLLEAVLESLELQGLSVNLEGVSITLDTQAFHREGKKLGFGSSAALTVALVDALVPDLDNIALYKIAQQCHLKLQNGFGSGADIALSAMRQSIVFQQNQLPSPIRLPSDLAMLAIWTGQPASSKAYLLALSRWQATQAKPYKAAMQQLQIVVEACLAALGKGNTQASIDQISEYDRQLAQFSIDTGLNFYNPTHLARRKQVELARCVYKPSGAGGGDFGIAYSINKTDIQNLAESLERQGIYTFPLIVQS